MRSPLAARGVTEAGGFGGQPVWVRVVAVFGGLAAGFGLRVQLLGGEPVVGESAGDGVALAVV